MKKVFEIYDKFAQWLCSFGSGKYVHLLFGLLISFAVAWVFVLTTAGATKPACAVCGIIAAVLVGLFKEVADFFRDKPFDARDWLFTAVGGAIGALMFLM
jgi:hypothetical protein|nr:MAG TPA: putative periplasmic lipoprotein [Caudoviricetes sp.]